MSETARHQAQLTPELALEALDNIPQLAWMADRTGAVYWFNQRWLDFTGMTLESMAGWGWQQVHHPAHVHRVVAKFLRSVAAGTAWEDTFPLRSKGGSFRWFLSRAVPIRDPSGQIQRWFGTNTDITEQRVLSDALQSAEARLRLATGAAELGTWDRDLVTDELVWSPEAKRMYGLALDVQPRLALIRNLTHPLDLSFVESTLDRAMKGADQGVFQCDYRILRQSDRAERWIAARGRVMFDAAGKPVRMLGTIIDITERKRSEGAQRFLSEATAVLVSTLDYRKTLEQVARLAVPTLADWAAVHLRNESGIVEQVAVEHVDPSKVRFATELQRRYPENPDAPGGIHQVIHTGQAVTGDVTNEVLVQVARDEEHLRILRKLGIQSYMLVPMIARGRVLGAFSLVSAESGRRYNAQDLELATHLARRAALAIENARLYQESREATRLREELLAIVSHDLKNPLSAVEVAAHLVARRVTGTSVEPSVRKQLETLQRSARRMAHLIGDLLDVGNIQSGRLKVERQPENVGALIEEVLEGNLPVALESGIQLRSDVVDELATARINVDRDRLLQAFGNLLGNAIKFCRPGEQVGVGCERRGDELLFSVWDTGPGIAPEELPHIFQPYWSAPRHSRKGTGLGLYITKGIIEAHGGRLWAESTVGVGTTFFFTLPALPVDAVAADLTH